MRSSTWPGVHVDLVVDGNVAQEYEDQEAENEHPLANHKTVTRYVEAVSGANFSLDVCFHDNFTYKQHDIQVRMLLDGVPAKTVIVQEERLRTRTSYRSTFNGAEKMVGGQWQLNRFAFAELETTDGAPKADLKETLSKIGEMTIHLTRVRARGQPYTSTAGSYQSYRPPVGGAIPEKALKGRAISSRTTLAGPERCAAMTFLSVDSPWGTEPFVTFKFLYRSHRDLQIEGIIPRSPSPTPEIPLEDRDPDSLTPEEARELIRRQREQLNSMTTIKREKREYSTVIEDDEHDDITVTQEQNRSSKRARTFRDSGVEIIDLSDD